MKILICIKQDLEGCLALNHALEKLKSHTLSIILSDKFTRTEREVPESAAFIFFERDLLVHQIFPLTELAGPGKNQTCRTFNQIRDVFDIPVVIADDINSPEWESYISDFQPDMILSVRNDFIFKKNIIRIPKLGIFNVHPGSLPEYRGVYAPFRAMFNRDRHAGCTLHQVDEGIDTGPLIGIATMPVDYSKSVLWHMCKLYPLGIDLFSALLSRLEAGEKIVTVPQDESKKCYYTFPTSAEFTDFKMRGNTLIDNQEYLDILNQFKPLMALDKTGSAH